MVQESGPAAACSPIDYRHVRILSVGIVRASEDSCNNAAFRRSYHGRTVRPANRLAPLTWSMVPADYGVRIRAVRAGWGDASVARDAGHQAFAVTPAA